MGTIVRFFCLVLYVLTKRRKNSTQVTTSGFVLYVFVEDFSIKKKIGLWLHDQKEKNKKMANFLPIGQPVWKKNTRIRRKTKRPDRGVEP
jgi:hypothetical protein